MGDWQGIKTNARAGWAKRYGKHQGFVLQSGHSRFLARLVLVSAHGISELMTLGDHDSFAMAARHCDWAATGQMRGDLPDADWATRDGNA